MYSVVAPVFSLLLGIGTLLLGVGLLGTLLGVRAGLEGFSAPVIGAVMSAYFAGYLLGTWWVPALIRRVGHIRTFAALAAVASACVVAHALWVQPLAWALLRLLSGACLVGLYLVIESWLNALVPNRRRGQMLAAYMTTTLMAMAGGQALMLTGDPRGFVLFGLVAMLVSLGLVPVALTRVAQPPLPETPTVVGLSDLFRISPLGVAGAFVTGAVLSAFWGMGAVFAQRLELGDGGVAAYMGSTILGGALLQWPAGHLSDRFDRRKVLTLFCFLAAGLAVAQFLAVPRLPWLLYPLNFACGGIAFSLYSLSVAHVNDHLGPAEVLAATQRLLLVYGVGAAIGPLGTGVLMDWIGPSSLPAALAVTLGLLGLFALYRMGVSQPIPEAEQGAFVPLVRTTQAAVELLPEADLEPEFDLTPAEEGPGGGET